MICTIYMRHQNAKETQKVALTLARHEPVVASADRHCLLAVSSLIAQVKSEGRIWLWCYEECLAEDTPCTVSGDGRCRFWEKARDAFVGFADSAEAVSTSAAGISIEALDTSPNGRYSGLCTALRSALSAEQSARFVLSRLFLWLQWIGGVPSFYGSRINAICVGRWNKRDGGVCSVVLRSSSYAWNRSSEGWFQSYRQSARCHSSTSSQSRMFIVGRTTTCRWLQNGALRCVRILIVLTFQTWRITAMTRSVFFRQMLEDPEETIEGFLLGSLKQFDVLTFFHSVGVRLITQLGFYRALHNVMAEQSELSAAISGIFLIIPGFA